MAERGRRRGMAILYLLALWTGLCAIVSLAVDYGRVQLVKSELQSAVDAAARAGATDLPKGVAAAQASAVQVAAANSADGQPVGLSTTTDIEFGRWDAINNTFTVLTGLQASTANAMRVTARRTAATSNPVKLHFASLFGKPTCDVRATAIAYLAPYGGGYIGLSLTRMYNTARFDAFNSAAGPYAPATAVPGNLLSFKDMWLYDNSTVYGEAHWDLSGIFNHDSTAVVSPGPIGAEKLGDNFPPVSVADVAVVNDNSKLSTYYSNYQLVIPDKKPPITYPAGTYYFTKFDIGKQNTVYFDGPTVIYLKCGGNIESTLAPSDLRPPNLAIRVAPGYNWKIDAGGVFYGSFYNPTGDVHHHNGGVSYGSVVSDLLCFRQTSQGHQDMSLGKYATAAGVYLVK